MVCECSTVKRIGKGKKEEKMNELGKRIGRENRGTGRTRSTTKKKTVNYLTHYS